MRVLLIGGTGEISYSCLEQAVSAGHHVTVYNRAKTAAVSRHGASQIIGDFDDDGAYAELADSRFDVVCQFLAYQPKAIDRDIATFAGRCGQYIYISSASVYSKPSPVGLLDEATPLGNPFWAYSRNKQACESQLWSSHLAATLPVTIVRPSHTYRQRLPSVVISGDHLAWRILQGKPVIVPDDGEAVWTLTHADDFARAFVQLFGRNEAIGECFNITEGYGQSWNRIIGKVAVTIGKPVDIRTILSTRLVEYEPEWCGPLLGDKSNTMIFDNARISRIAEGWHCEVSLDQGLATMWPQVADRLATGYKPDVAIDALIDRIVTENG